MSRSFSADVVYPYNMSCIQRELVNSREFGVQYKHILIYDKDMGNERQQYTLIVFTTNSPDFFQLPHFTTHRTVTEFTTYNI